MKEHLYNYLRQKGAGASAEELLEQVLKIKSAPEEVGRRLFESIVAGDTRFQRDAQGLWHVEPLRATPLEETLWLFAEALALPPTGDVIELGFCQTKGLQAQSTIIAFVHHSGRCRFEWASDEAGLAPTEVRRLEDTLASLWAMFRDARIVSFHPSPLIQWLNDAALQLSGDTLEVQPISLQRLARRLFEGQRFRALEDVAAFLGMRYIDKGRVVGKLELALEVFGEMLRELQARAVLTIADLLDFLGDEEPIDFSRYAFGREFLRTLPQRPGVYLMKDRFGEIIYVGKAKNLRTRVGSYFYHRDLEEKKVRTLLDKIHSIEFQVLGSELEALLLEQRYIAQYQPPINRQVTVHPRTARRFKEKNVIIIQPSKVEQALELFLVSRGGWVRQVSVHKDGEDLQSLREACQELFFSQRREGVQEESHTIVSRWLTLNQDQVTWIEVDALGTLDHCMAVLENYITDPATVVERVQRF